MTHCLHRPCLQERELQQRLRHIIDTTIQAHGYSKTELAQRLDLLPSGVTTLLAKTWSISEAFRIAQALEIQLTITISEPSASLPTTTL